MNIDFSKKVEIIIRDKDGKMTDRFEIEAAAFIKDKVRGNRLELTKKQ